MDENLATLFEVVADEAGDRTAIVHGDDVHSWHDVDERASRLAQHLLTEGISEGARIAIALLNGAEYVETILAVMKLRALPINVNFRYKEREIVELFDYAKPDALVLDQRLSHRYLAIADQLPAPRRLIRVGQHPSSNSIDGIDYHRVINETPPLARFDRSGNDGWLMFTGGTTGRPKGIYSRHHSLVGTTGTGDYGIIGIRLPPNLEAFRQHVRDRIAAERRRVTLIAPPLMHATGLYNAFGTLLRAGTVVFLPSRPYDASEACAYIQRHRVTHLCIAGDAFAVPLADALDQAAQDGAPYNLSSLRRINSSGARWSPGVKARLLQHCDVTLDDLLASSEGGPLARAVATRHTPVITGRFRPLPRCRVLGHDGNDVTPGSGTVGELAIAVSDARAYLAESSESARTFRTIKGESYVFIGDLATVESDGSIRFLGRSGRIIETGGEKVFAEEIELVIGEHPSVHDVNVVGVPDPRWGQRIVAVVAPRRGTAVNPTQIIDHVRANIAHHKCPREIIVVPQVRRAPTGKIDRSWLQDTVRERGGVKPKTSRSTERPRRTESDYAVNWLRYQLDLEREKNFAIHDAMVRHFKLQIAPSSSPDARISPIEKFRGANPDRCVIAFAGMGAGRGIPVREFTRTLTTLGPDILFIKDFMFSWYQRGLAGISSDVESTAGFLSDLVSAYQSVPNTVGTSAGGFAAILFAALLGSSTAVAFGPQTQVKPQDSHLLGIEDDDEISRQTLDLRAVLTRHPVPDVRIYYGAQNRADTEAVQRLEDVGGVTLFPCPTDDHNVAGWLRDQGELAGVLRAALA